MPAAPTQVEWRFPHTVPAKGYRFHAPMLEPNAGPTTTPAPPEQVAIRAPLRRWALWIALVATAFFVAYSARTYISQNSKAGSGKVMLVVMPFVNRSDDPRQDYFADGVTEEMSGKRGALDPAHLDGIARTSSMQYKGARKDAAEIARELDAIYLLEGAFARKVSASV